jgi:hypothetical protein
LFVVVALRSSQVTEHIHSTKTMHKIYSEIPDEQLKRTKKEKIRAVRPAGLGNLPFSHLLVQFAPAGVVDKPRSFRYKPYPMNKNGIWLCCCSLNNAVRIIGDK